MQSNSTSQGSESPTPDRQERLAELYRAAHPAKKERLTGAELYRAACMPVQLPENFCDSLMFYIGTTYDWSTPISVALRSAVGEAAEWLAIAAYETPEPQDSKDPMSFYARGTQHQMRYCANTLLRRIAQNLCRKEVPRNERIL